MLIIIYNNNRNDINKSNDYKHYYNDNRNTATRIGLGLRVRPRNTLHSSD